jgi:hypothetical protein
MIMKNLLYLVFALTILSLSCSKSVDGGSPTQGWIYGQGGGVFNAEVWEVPALVRVLGPSIDEGQFSVSLSIVDEFDILREKLHFSKVPLLEGTYPLYIDDAPPGSGIVTTFGFLEADVILKSYYPIKDEGSNFITVDSINTEINEVWGTFAVTLAHLQGSTSEYPDTVFVRDGWYKGVINFRK